MSLRAEFRSIGHRLRVWLMQYMGDWMRFYRLTNMDVGLFWCGQNVDFHLKTIPNWLKFQINIHIWTLLIKSLNSHRGLTEDTWIQISPHKNTPRIIRIATARKNNAMRIIKTKNIFPGNVSFFPINFLYVLYLRIIAKSRYNVIRISSKLNPNPLE